MTLEELFSTTRIETLGNVCAVGDVHPRRGRAWAAEHGVAYIRGEYVFTFEEAQEMLDDLAAEDDDEEELEDDSDEDDSDEDDSDEDDSDEDDSDEDEFDDEDDSDEDEFDDEDDADA